MEVPDFDLKKQKIATLTKKKFGCKSAKKVKIIINQGQKKNLDSIENL